jgi:hypothetical protein
MELVIEVLVVVLALALTVISYTAYKKSHLRAALYLVLAFLLLAIKKIVEVSNQTLRVQQETGFVVDVLELLIVVLFFLALWRR